MATEARSERTQLSRESVIDAALAKADRDGVQALTFRRLARDLGVTPMALYRYVASKDELLHAVAERAFEDVELPDREPSPWQDRLRALAHSYRRVLLVHPAIAALQVAGHGAGRINGIRAVEVLLGALRDAGFSVIESAVLQARLERFVFTMVLLESQVASATGNEEQQLHNREAEAFFATLAPDQFPNVVAASQWLCDEVDHDWAFELALDVMVGGLEKLLAQR
jgi:TetR/AcrR family tetracycline transcriptional repressor